MVSVTEKEDKIEVSTPYIESLPLKFRNMGGKWDSIKKVWVFKKEDKERVEAFLSKFFGFDINSKRVAAIVTARERVSAERACVSFKGFVLAQAWGRDSGARVGEGVALVSGDIDSSGSVKNWYSAIEKGAVFSIENFPSVFEENEKFEVKF